jgi:major membrane immunogen (membrane-anchored lipoprotein)
MKTASLISLFFLVLFSFSSPSFAQDKDIDAHLKSFERDIWLMDRSVKQMEDYPRKLDGNLKRQDAQRAKEERMAEQKTEVEWIKKIKEHDVTVKRFEKRAREIERTKLP